VDVVSTATAETILQAIKTRLEAQITGIHVSEQIDIISADPRALADQGSAILRAGDEIAEDYPTRLKGKVRVTDTIEVQTAWKVDPRDQLTSRDQLLARGRAIRIALTGSWGDIENRRIRYQGSEGPARLPGSAEWLILIQRFTFSRFAELG
jgi:hypothetical protein